MTLQDTVELMEKALDVDIVTRGGGDFPRNVMANPLSGVEQGEYFDVLPYAEAAAEYMLILIKKIESKNQTHKSQVSGFFVDIFFQY